MDKLDRILKDIPRKMGGRVITKSARKAAKPILSEARLLVKHAPRETEGNLDGFQHLYALSKATKIVTYKNGVNVQISPSTPDIPMASLRRFWNAFGVGKLFAQGRQREGRGKRNRSTGLTDGIGDWIEEAGRKRKTIAQYIFNREMRIELDKAIKDSIRRNGG